jgi:hypothetical protein
MPPRKKAEPEPVVEPAADEEVEVEFGEDPGETATLLLAAAEELHGDQSLVRTGTGVFYVPKSVADKAKKK